MRVVITGLGVVSPIGKDKETFLQNLISGISGADNISLFDASGFTTKIAAEIKNLPLPTPSLPFKGGGLGRGCIKDRKIIFGLDAAKQAMQDAFGDDIIEGKNGCVSLGVGLELFSMGDMTDYKNGKIPLPKEIQDKISFIQTPSDLCVHLISHIYGIKNPPHLHISACAAGTDAIGNAFHKIRRGQVKWAVAGGTDSMINPLGLGGFCKISAMSSNNDNPKQASRPFDEKRDGFVLGEGAGILILEELEHALTRGANIYGEVVGYANTLDAYAISEPHPEGIGGYNSMKGAIADAGLNPQDIDVINAHGTSTPKNDEMESLAIERLFGKNTPVYSIKSMIGHLISAAGAVEAIAGILAMNKNKIPPTINLENPCSELDYVVKTRDMEYDYFLSNSFGFGGHNASVVVRK